MEDEKIVDLYWNRDPQAIEQSEEKYGHYCFTVAQNVLGDYEDSRECVNDTWLAAWNRIPPARPVVLRMFLVKLARRISVNRLKANRAGKRGGGELPMVLEELSECLPDKGTVEDEILGRELGACINRFVRGLPEREADIFCRRYFFTESLAEITAGFGLTKNHVSVILNRTRSRLKNYLREEGYIHE